MKMCVRHSSHPFGWHSSQQRKSLQMALKSFPVCDKLLTGNPGNRDFGIFTVNGRVAVPLRTWNFKKMNAGSVDTSCRVNRKDPKIPESRFPVSSLSNTGFNLQY